MQLSQRFPAHRRLLGRPAAFVLAAILPIAPAAAAPSAQRAAAAMAADPQLAPSDPGVDALSAAARAFQDSQVRGTEVRAAVKRTLGTLQWHRDLDSAARAARELERPIVWVQALGEIRGFT
jgi:hypothetical protein